MHVRIYCQRCGGDHGEAVCPYPVQYAFPPYYEVPSEEDGIMPDIVAECTRSETETTFYFHAQSNDPKLKLSAIVSTTDEDLRQTITVSKRYRIQITPI